MPHYESSSLYISLKGDWPAAAVSEVAQYLEGFFDTLSHDGFGEPGLSEGGLAFAYDVTLPDADDLQSLFDALDKGPAWVVRLEEGDELGITNHVRGPGLATIATVNGDLADPVLPLSMINDGSYIDRLRAAQEIGKMPFRQI